MMRPKNSAAKNYNRLILLLGLAGFISAADNWLVAPILPAIAAGFGASIARGSIIITAYMIPYGAMQPVYGFFSDRHRKVKLLRFIVGGLAAGTAGCALTQSLIQLCVLRIITGFFAAGIIAVSLALIGDTVPDTQRQVYVGRFMGIVFLGQGISTGLGGFCAGLLNWRIAFWFFGSVAVLVVILLRSLPDMVAVPHHEKFIPTFKLTLTAPKGRVIFPLAFSAGCLLLGIYSYIGSYLHEKSNAGYLQTGLIMMFYGLACLLAGTQVGRFALRLKAWGALLTGSCLALCSSLLLAFSSRWQAGLLAVVCLGCGYIFIQSTLATLAFEVSNQSKGLSSGLIGLCLFCGGGIGTIVSSWVLAHGGYKVLWLFLAGGILLFMIGTTKLAHLLGKFNMV